MELPNSERKKVTLAALDLETVRIVCYREEKRERPVKREVRSRRRMNGWKWCPGRTGHYVTVRPSPPASF